MFSMNADAENSATFGSDHGDIVLKSCQICGRSFNPKSLERHQKICEKSKRLSNRTVFNSFLQRAKEIQAVPVTVETKEKEKNKTKRKEERDNILRVARGSKNPGEVLNNGLSPQKVIPSGYQQCPACERYFNPKAADRHISWCQEQRSRLPKTPPNSVAIERLKARVQYRAPLPRRKSVVDPIQRLVKSADSVRESSRPSSLPGSNRDSTAMRHSTSADLPSSLRKQNKNHSNILPSCTSNENIQNVSSPKEERKSKKVVKFKEIFPVYNKERNKNLDMLAALRLRLSELSTSDDFLEDFMLESDESRFSLKSNSKVYCSPSAVKATKDSWTSDGEVNLGSSSSSDGSFPSVSRAGSSEGHLPRFCYNCGTKYPIVSAKYCCECGAQRFIFGMSDKRLSVQ